MLDLNILFSIRLIIFERNLNARLIKKYLNNNHEGFTLVELIVVVVIIGILSAIAIPSFQNASDKAKQKEASVLLASYVKAAQSYYVEYGALPRTSQDLGNYISVTACCTVCSGRQTPQYCKASAPINLNNRSVNNWNSPSGLYAIGMYIRSNQLQFTANPTAWFQGYGVGACFSGITGSSKVSENIDKRRLTTPPNCN